MKFRVPPGYVLVKETDYRALLEKLDWAMKKITELEGQLKQSNERIKELEARLNKLRHNGSGLSLFEKADKVISVPVEGACCCGAL